MSEILDAEGRPINIGDTVEHVIRDDVGVVTDIILPETHDARPAYMPIAFGDLVIRTSSCSSTVSSNHRSWRVIETLFNDFEQRQ